MPFYALVSESKYLCFNLHTSHPTHTLVCHFAHLCGDLNTLCVNLHTCFPIHTLVCHATHLCDDIGTCVSIHTLVCHSTHLCDILHTYVLVYTLVCVSTQLCGNSHRAFHRRHIGLVWCYFAFSFIHQLSPHTVKKGNHLMVEPAVLLPLPD